MSGHSKWSSIKHKKGAADAKRGKLFSKLTRAIIVAAKEGGADPAANLALQNAIEKARADSMPKDNIERAIARGAGTGADAAHVRDDRRTRATARAASRCSSRRSPTTATARRPTCATSSRRTTATSAERARSRGCSSARASCSSTARADEDELTLAAAEARRGGRRARTARAPRSRAPEDLHAVRDALEAAGFTVDVRRGRRWCRRRRSRSTTRSAAKKVLRLIDALEENDDVQDVYANFDIPERVLETVAV